MESILQDDPTQCYLCGMNRNLEPLDCHHVYGSSNRKHSEKYGLKVYLHHNKCHIFGRDSVHQNARIDRMLKAETQKKAMQHYGWSIAEFINIFGMNFLEE